MSHREAGDQLGKLNFLRLRTSQMPNTYMKTAQGILRLLEPTTIPYVTAQLTKRWIIPLKSPSRGTKKKVAVTMEKMWARLGRP